MRKFFIILAVIIVLIPVALYLVREPLIKMAINNVGTSMTGTEVSVDDVTLSPFSGLVALHGLKVANPEGYSQNNVLQIDEARVRFTPSSLFSGVVKIQEVAVEAPQVLLEGGIEENNLLTLQNALMPAAEETPATKAKSEPESEPESEPKSEPTKLPAEIDVVQISNGRIAMTGLVNASLNLSNITLRDIGKDGKPLSGTVSVGDVAVANPEGYKAQNAVSIDEILVLTEFDDVLSGPVKIQEVTISQPQIWVEGGFSDNNLTALKNKLPQSDSEPSQKSSDEAEPKEAARPIQIDLLQIVDATAHLTHPLKTTLALEPIKVQGIGKGDEGASLADVTGIVMSQMTSVAKAVVSTRLSEEVKTKGKEVLKNVTDKAKDKLGGVGKKIGEKFEGFFGD